MLGINWPSWGVQVVVLKEPVIPSPIIALDGLYVVLYCCHAHVQFICSIHIIGYIKNSL